MKTQNMILPLSKTEIQFNIGQNKEENSLIISQSASNDYWFHLQNDSSCHVIAHIPVEIKMTRKERGYIIRKGAELCKLNSKMKNEKNVSIIFTKMQNVVQTDKVGQVEITENPSIIIV
jgi:predicted ribosome quality control (RQC) complex YloA/Tae2 family protein